MSVTMRRRAGLAVKYLLLIALVALFVPPLFWMVSASLKTVSEIYTFPPVWIPASPRWRNYVDAWNAAPFARFYLNTVITTFFGVVLHVGLAVLSAYAVVFVEFRYRTPVFLAILAALMVPAEVTILPNYLTIASLSWLNTYQGIVIPGAASAFGVFLLRQHFLTLPVEVIEAARMEGAGHLRLLWHVVMPLSRPMLATVTLISLVAKWNAYLWPLLSTNTQVMRVLPVALQYLKTEEGGQQWGLVMAATMFVVVPVLAVFVWAQRHIIAGLTAGATKG
jgi:ABC-type glycerol-3-phosphate transport system permease component